MSEYEIKLLANLVSNRKCDKAQCVLHIMFLIIVQLEGPFPFKLVLSVVWYASCKV